MITRREMMKSLGLGSTALAAMLLAALPAAEAEAAQAKPKAKSVAPPGGAKGVTVTKIFEYPLDEVAKTNVVLVRVDFAPGAASTPHRHPGSVIAYVLEGEVENQVLPGPVSQYKRGEAWYESPGAVHQVARNPSKTAPAAILAFMLVPHGKPLVLPAEDKH
jgi:quercetin dioxygenase-like cupin family protein